MYNLHLHIYSYHIYQKFLAYLIVHLFNYNFDLNNIKLRYLSDNHHIHCNVILNIDYFDVRIYNINDHVFVILAIVSLFYHFYLI